MRILILTVFLFCTGNVYGNDYTYSCEYSDRQSEQEALACNIFFEASSEQEGYVGRMAVALVVVNRINSDRFPNNVVDVIYQRRMFSWTHDGKSDRIPNTYLDNLVWEECLQISKEVLSIKHKNYKFFDYTKGSMWYHSTSVNPDWADKKYLTVKINNHLFYWDDVKK